MGNSRIKGNRRKILAIDDCWTKVRVFGVVSGDGGHEGHEIWPNFCLDSAGPVQIFR
jgi:hypothetical protein